MDDKYITHVSASPHIDEGFWDRLKSRGASTVQKYKGITGQGWEDPQESKINSLWKSFKNKVLPLLKDFNKNVVPNIKTNRPKDITPSVSRIFVNFKELEKLLSGETFAPYQTKNLFTTRRYDDPTIGRNLAEALYKEGIEKIFTRDFDILKALSSNNTKITIDAYKKKLKKYFDEFINDAKTVSPEPSKIISKISQSNPSISDAIKKVKILTSVPKPKSQASASQVPPSSPQTLNVGTGTPPVLSPSNSGVPPKLNGTNHNPDLDLTRNVLMQTMDIIINTVASDKFRSALYFNYPLPTEYDDPAWAAAKKKFHTGISTSKVTEADDEIDPENDEGEELEEPIEPPSSEEDTHDFLHKFHYNYRKYRTFAMKLGSFSLNVNGKPKAFEVIWSSSGHPGDERKAFMNTISVKTHSDTQGKTVTIPLFQFFDHMVDSRTPEGKEFSLENILYQGNSKLKDAFDIIPNKDFYKDKIQRAFMAAVDRKTMEFKGKKPTSPNVSDAILALKKLGISRPEDFVQMAVDKLGKDAETGELTRMAVKLSGVKPGTTTTPPTPPPTEPPKEKEPEEIPNKQVSPQKTGNPKEKELSMMNSQLSGLGVETLDTIEQLNKFNSLRGSYHKRLKTLDDSGKIEFYKKIIGRIKHNSPITENFPKYFININ